jgi:hypothetical protein
LVRRALRADREALGTAAEDRQVEVDHQRRASFSCLTISPGRRRP